MTNWALIAITAMFTLVLSIDPLSYAFHDNLGIDDNKASQLYQTNPNDPAIVQWKNALQSAITSMDKCFTIDEAISCQPLIPLIVSNCKSHPNTLLACNDARLPQYPLILKQAQEGQKRAEEAQTRAEEAEEASVIINTCSNNSTAFSCDAEMRLLQRDCQLAPSPHDYCKNELFLGYLKQHNISNSTVAP